MTQRQRKVREAARSMLTRYGEEALQQVDQRIQELEKHGEEETAWLWQEIRSEVAHLLGIKPLD